MSSSSKGLRLTSNVPPRPPPKAKGITRLLRLVLAAHGPLWPLEMVRLTGFGRQQVYEARYKLTKRGEIEAVDERRRGHVREKRWGLAMSRREEVDLQSPDR